jgi:hypothetical protein
MSNWMFWKHAVSECNCMKEISGMKILQLLYWVQKYFAEHLSGFLLLVISMNQLSDLQLSYHKVMNKFVIPQWNIL